MKTAIASLALAFSSAAHPAVIAWTETQDKSAIMNFHDEQGPCSANARKAEFVKTGSPGVVGCWVVRAGGFVTVSWLDGDFDQVPLNRLRHDSI